MNFVKKVSSIAECYDAVSSIKLGDLDIYSCEL